MQDTHILCLSVTLFLICNTYSSSILLDISIFVDIQVSCCDKPIEPSDFKGKSVLCLRGLPRFLLIQNCFRSWLGRFNVDINLVSFFTKWELSYVKNSPPLLSSVSWVCSIANKIFCQIDSFVECWTFWKIVEHGHIAVPSHHQCHNHPTWSCPTWGCDSTCSFLLLSSVWVSWQIKMHS